MEEANKYLEGENLCGKRSLILYILSENIDLKGITSDKNERRLLSQGPTNHHDPLRLTTASVPSLSRSSNHAILEFNPLDVPVTLQLHLRYWKSKHRLLPILHSNSCFTYLCTRRWYPHNSSWPVRNSSRLQDIYQTPLRLST